jgi:tRNA-2-methylthio-N6-dimethylallyladenosine synthase
MRRRYTRERFSEITEALRAARPDVALTTDLIVAFPGETESEFSATLDLVREVGFVDSYSFKYSPRPGTAASELPGGIPAQEAQERLEALQNVQRELTLAYHHSRVGQTTEILVEGASRRADQVRGRDPYHRVVNLVVEAAAAPAPGTLLGVQIVEATPHSLIGQARELIGHGEAPGPGVAPGHDSENRTRGVKVSAGIAEESGRSVGSPDSAREILRVL